MAGRGNSLNISPLFGSSKALFISSLAGFANQLVVLEPNNKAADEINVELSILGSTDLILFSEFKPEDIQQKLAEISSKKKFILISTYELLNISFPEKEKIEKSVTSIQAGGDLTYDNILEYLNLLNYQKDKFVEAPGEYSQRGAIIDFWSFSERNPVRLEFNGDFLESIRYFDPDSQRSTDAAGPEGVTLAASINEITSGSFSTIFDYLDDPILLASSYELKNLSLKKTGLSSGLRKESLKVISSNVDDNIFDDEFPEPPQVEKEEGNESRPADWSSLELLQNSRAKWILEEEIGDQRIELGFSEAPAINSNYEILFSKLKEYSGLDYKIIITAENEIQSSRLQDLLIEFNKDFAEMFDSGKVKIETLAIKKGFLHKDSRLLLLTDYQIFNKPYRSKIPHEKKFKKSKSKTFASIKKGDYVVHEDYGIGKYVGLETIKIGDINQESMKLLYNEGGVVYVNLNYLSLVKRYSSNDNLSPSLSTLGTTDWTNTKNKTKKKIKEAARELIELYARRKATKGYSFSPDTVWQKELEASFIYEDTPDQEKVTEEVKDDMQAENPMDRLICGDVGFGKTEVAVRAAFKAAQDGKQTAVLVPTTILAEQHYNTFKDRLVQFPVRTAVISRFLSKKQQSEILKDLDEGKLDVIIGTHRLLSKDVRFKDLGLLIIDEEHRFGVMSKEKLRSLKLNVDTLTLTATPIPRTLNLSLLGARDLSIIATPPPNRQPIYTYVSVFDVFKIKEWIMSEIKRNGQVYFVHDRIQSIDKLAGYLNKYIPGIRIGIAHGQMKPVQLENVIHGFLNRKYDLLLSTKIIESGIDIPNVNTIIINRADRFGLAELHQLRGRVGRSSRQAYAYLIVPSLTGITKKALRRLQAIEEFTEIGAGFNLSMRDLEIRGAGNLLGTEQSGFINDVGFDLYLKLINQAVEELKYQEFKEIFKTLPKLEERTEPTIDTYFEIGIPEIYMPEQVDRLNFYTGLFSIKSIQDLDELTEEMKDRFGPLPLLVQRLAGSAAIKYYASYALFERVVIQRKNIFLILPKGEKEDYYKYRFIELMRFIMNNYKDKVKFNQQKETMKLIIPNNFESPETLIDFLIEFCKSLKELYIEEPKLQETE
ncbi:MAG TPA: transcription-repair coupling factor [Ignavibacteriaceae bacterium]|nr:transcription-repair coupling factor [Ignavibacteriaceae bacterium]